MTIPGLGTVSQVNPPGGGERLGSGLGLGVWGSDNTGPRDGVIGRRAWELRLGLGLGVWYSDFVIGIKAGVGSKWLWWSPGWSWGWLLGSTRDVMNK